MPVSPSSAWDESSLLAVCAQAAALASRLTSEFAGVIWPTVRGGEAGEWLIEGGQPPVWRSYASPEPHPWQAHQPLFRIPVPGEAGLTLAACCEDCADGLHEVAALLSATMLTKSAPRLRQLLESTRDGVFLLDRN